MSKFVESVVISSVRDLYVQFARYARSYDLRQNPLTGLTQHIPEKALYYTVVAESETEMAEALMTRLAGRRKLNVVRVHKDAIKHPAFEPTNQMVIYYA